VVKEFIAHKWKILEPVVSHALDAVALAIVVRGTSFALKSFLPPEYYEPIHQSELFFYVCLCGSLSIYTFFLFCLALTLELVDAGRNAVRRVIGNQEPYQLSPHNGQDEIHVRDKKREKVR
jgi:hypothetical protein